MAVGVPVLPPEGFEDRVRALGRAVVLFTADWCGYCARFAPAFERAAAASRVPLVAADISDDEADPRWERYGIEVVPTVLLFEDGRPAARLDGELGRGLAPERLAAFLREHAA